MMRMVWAAAAVVLAGCATSVTGAATHTATPSPSAAEPVGARSTCGGAFPHQVILGWRASTVAQLRAYQHGGPAAQAPVRSAFHGVPGDHAGAWCLIGQGVNTATLWAAVDGVGTQRAITISGPGAGDFRGELTAVPQPP